MKRKRSPVLVVMLLALGILFLSSAGIVHADGLVPCGGRGENPCTLCHFIVGIHGIIAWFMTVMVFLALAIITAMGILYIVSGGNEGTMKTAKGGLWNALAGILIVLFAWLIVNVTMFWILPANDDLGVEAEFRLSSGFQFQCDTTSTANLSGFSYEGGLDGTGETGGTGGSGTCMVLNSGPCSISNLAIYFGSTELATEASGICNAESRGIATVPSGVDKCQPGGEVVSYGLFQINLSANKVGGLNCPSAFSAIYTKSNHSCTITNPTLYRQCVAAAKNPTNNIKAAVEIQKSGGWGRWGANSKCKY